MGFINSKGTSKTNVSGSTPPRPDQPRPPEAPKRAWLQRLLFRSNSRQSVATEEESCRLSKGQVTSDGRLVGNSMSFPSAMMPISMPSTPVAYTSSEECPAVLPSRGEKRAAECTVVVEDDCTPGEVVDLDIPSYASEAPMSPTIGRSILIPVNSMDAMTGTVSSGQSRLFPANGNAVRKERRVGRSPVSAQPAPLPAVEASPAELGWFVADAVASRPVHDDPLDAGTGEAAAAPTLQVAKRPIRWAAAWRATPTPDRPVNERVFVHGSSGLDPNAPLEVVRRALHPNPEMRRFSIGGQRNAAGAAGSGASRTAAPSGAQSPTANGVTGYDGVQLLPEIRRNSSITDSIIMGTHPLTREQSMYRYRRRDSQASNNLCRSAMASPLPGTTNVYTGGNDDPHGPVIAASDILLDSLLESQTSRMLPSLPGGGEYGARTQWGPGHHGLTVTATRAFGGRVRQHHGRVTASSVVDTPSLCGVTGHGFDGSNTDTFTLASSTDDTGLDASLRYMSLNETTVLGSVRSFSARFPMAESYASAGFHPHSTGVTASSAVHGYGDAPRPASRSSRRTSDPLSGICHSRISRTPSEYPLSVALTMLSDPVCDGCYTPDDERARSRNMQESGGSLLPPPRPRDWFAIAREWAQPDPLPMQAPNDEATMTMREGILSIDTLDNGAGVSYSVARTGVEESYNYAPGIVSVTQPLVLAEPASMQPTPLFHSSSFPEAPAGFSPTLGVYGVENTDWESLLIAEEKQHRERIMACEAVGAVKCRTYCEYFIFSCDQMERMEQHMMRWLEKRLLRGEPAAVRNAWAQVGEEKRFLFRREASDQARLFLLHTATVDKIHHYSAQLEQVQGAYADLRTALLQSSVCATSVATNITMFGVTGSGLGGAAGNAMPELGPSRGRLHPACGVQQNRLMVASSTPPPGSRLSEVPGLMRPAVISVDVLSDGPETTAAPSLGTSLQSGFMAQTTPAIVRLPSVKRGNGSSVNSNCAATARVRASYGGGGGICGVCVNSENDTSTPSMIYHSMPVLPMPSSGESLDMARHRLCAFPPATAADTTESTSEIFSSHTGRRYRQGYTAGKSSVLINSRSTGSGGNSLLPAATAVVTATTANPSAPSEQRLIKNGPVRPPRKFGSSEVAPSTQPSSPRAPQGPPPPRHHFTRRASHAVSHTASTIASSFRKASTLVARPPVSSTSTSRHSRVRSVSSTNNTASYTALGPLGEGGSYDGRAREAEWETFWTGTGKKSPVDLPSTFTAALLFVQRKMSKAVPGHHGASDLLGDTTATVGASSSPATYTYSNGDEFFGRMQTVLRGEEERAQRPPGPPGGRRGTRAAGASEQPRLSLPSMMFEREERVRGGGMGLYNFANAATSYFGAWSEDRPHGRGVLLIIHPLHTSDEKTGSQSTATTATGTTAATATPLEPSVFAVSSTHSDPGDIVHLLQGSRDRSVRRNPPTTVTHRGLHTPSNHPHFHNVARGEDPAAARVSRVLWGSESPETAPITPAMTLLFGYWERGRLTHTFRSVSQSPSQHTV